MPSRAEQKILRSLHRRKGREEHGLFLVEGPRLLEELLASDLEPVRLYHTHERAPEGGGGEAALVAECRSRGVRTEEISVSEMEEYSDAVTPQGLLAVAPVPEPGWPALPADGLLLFDGVQDPGNLGTLIRTAEALGMAGAVSLKGTVDAWNPKVVRAAAGSSFRVPIVDARWEEARPRLRDRGTEIWASDTLGEPVYHGEPRPEGLAIVLGNEARGVTERVLGTADRAVRVPIAGPVDSLNVAVAGALLIDRVFGAAGPRPSVGAEGARGGRDGGDR